ncbi:MAG: inositol phosphatase, partial [Synechococcaceae cyanobacterium]
MTTTAAASDLDPSLSDLLDLVAERQRQDFGHMVSDQKADGSLITA